MAHPLPKCNAVDLVNIAKALTSQAHALEEIASHCRHRDLGFHTPRGREDELRHHVAHWRWQVGQDADDMRALARRLLHAADDITAALPNPKP